MVPQLLLMISAVVTVTVEEGTNVVKTSRYHVQRSTKNSSRCHVIHVMMFLIMKLCVRHVRADVVIGVAIISAIVTVTVEDGTGAAKTSR